MNLDDHDLSRRIELLDRNGIDVALISLPPTMEVDGHEELVEAFCTGMLEVVEESGGRLRPLAYGECREGFAGACVSAAAVVDGLDPLLDQLEAAGQMLFVHPGPPAALPPGAPRWWPAIADYTAQMQAAYFAWIADGAKRHPNLRVVFAILAGGAPFQLERLRSRDPGSTSTHGNVFLDTASYGRRALELSLDAVGASRLVYGSDVPVIESRPTLRALADLGAEIEETVRRKNPTHLFA